MYKYINTVLLYSEIRGEFERYLTSYVETRIVFEEKLDQVLNLLNMLTLMESEPGEVKPKLKTKIKELLESGLIYALKVGKRFNKMTNYDLSVVLEISGNYSWYSIRRGQALLA